jgi:hypothetical protein
LNLIRIGKIVVNFEQVTDIVSADPDDPNPESLTINFSNGKTITFNGDDAHGLLVFLDKTVKSAAKPLDDFILQ